MLEVSGLKTRHGYIQALNGIGFKLKKGELLSIVGSNGAGKSTLLGTIAGIYRPSEGRILFGGEDITDWNVERVVAAGICLVPERRQVFDSLSVKDNLLLGAYQRFRKNKKTVYRDFDKIVELFPKLKTMLNRPVGLLSGGEQQMLAIGRGLMSDPKLMMLDEPSLGLAPLVVKSIMGVFAQLKKEFDTTIILVEQNVKAALSIADYAFVLERGQIRIQGTAKQLMDHPEVRNAYLGIGKETDQETQAL
jgi:branched-chain amino acid transport system ATP-binding protein